MKCPCCGHEMVLDGHRKMDMYMCYECGYMESFHKTAKKSNVTNYEKLRGMNLNQAAAFMSGAFNIDTEKLANWLEKGSVA